MNKLYKRMLIMVAVARFDFYEICTQVCDKYTFTHNLGAFFDYKLEQAHHLLVDVHEGK